VRAELLDGDNKVNIQPAIAFKGILATNGNDGALPSKYSVVMQVLPR